MAQDNLAKILFTLIGDLSQSGGLCRYKRDVLWARLRSVDPLLATNLQSAERARKEADAEERSYQSYIDANESEATDDDGPGPFRTG